MIRAVIILLALSLTASSMAPAEDTDAGDFTLGVEVFDDRGGPAYHGAVVIRGNGYLRTHMITKGLMGLELPDGVFELVFSKEGYYDLVLSGVGIEKSTQAARQRVAKTLRVKMTPRLYFERDLTIIGPRYVEAPSLSIVFRPDEPAVMGRAARGTLTFTNVGDEPQMLPLGPESRWSPEKSWVLSLSLEVEGLRAAYYGNFACNPPDGCHMLSPGESVQVPLHLISRRSYGRGRVEPTTWGGSGTFVGSVGFYLAQPLAEGERQSTQSRSVEADFRLTILDKAGDPK